MSLSRYESERGTVGRGTPPIPREGQPRLDMLLLQLHRRQVYICIPDGSIAASSSIHDNDKSFISDTIIISVNGKFRFNNMRRSIHTP